MEVRFGMGDELSNLNIFPDTVMVTQTGSD